MSKPITIKEVTAEEHLQRLLTYIRANLRRYAERTGTKANKDFILDAQTLLEKYEKH